MNRNYDVITFFFQNIFILTSCVANFAVQKQPLKTQKKVKELEVMY